MAKRESRFLVRQKLAVAGFGVLLIAIFGYLTWWSVAESNDGEFVEGEHYTVIDDPRRIRGDKIEVMEFFSYGCVHCYRFDPELNDWVAKRGSEIDFIRIPAVANDYWRHLGRNYYTLTELGLGEEIHTRFFRVVHDGRQLMQTEEDLQKFYEQQGVDPEAFTTAFNSARVLGDLTRADQMARRMKVSSVPAIVIQGKYLLRPTRTMGTTRMLDVMDYLVDREKSSTPD